MRTNCQVACRRFLFQTVTESTILPDGQDTILDFKKAQGDSIDLHMIDANTHAGGNQAFHFIGDHAFTRDEGELRFNFKNGNTIVNADINGDGDSDFRFVLEGKVNLSASDFAL